MRVINTNDRVDNLIKEAQKILRQILKERFIGELEINDKTRKFVRKIWQLDEPEETNDAPKLGLNNGK